MATSTACRRVFMGGGGAPAGVDDRALHHGSAVAQEGAKLRTGTLPRPAVRKAPATLPRICGRGCLSPRKHTHMWGTLHRWIAAGWLWITTAAGVGAGVPWGGSDPHMGVLLYEWRNLGAGGGVHTAHRLH